MDFDRSERGGTAAGDRDRKLAACLPFLLDAPLADPEWPDRADWNLRRSPDLGSGFEPEELYDLAWRMRRILVTSNAEYLDDDRFPVATCPGVIVVGPAWRRAVDRLLVTIVGLLGPFGRLYHGVKVEAREGDMVAVIGPSGPRGLRSTRGFHLEGKSQAPVARAEAPATALRRNGAKRAARSV